MSVLTPGIMQRQVLISSFQMLSCDEMVTLMQRFMVLLSLLYTPNIQNLME